MHGLWDVRWGGKTRIQKRGFQMSVCSRLMTSLCLPLFPWWPHRRGSWGSVLNSQNYSAYYKSLPFLWTVFPCVHLIMDIGTSLSPPQPIKYKCFKGRDHIIFIPQFSPLLSKMPYVVIVLNDAIICTSASVSPLLRQEGFSIIITDV